MINKPILTTLIISILVVCSFSAQFTSTHQNIDITSEKDLSDLLLAHLGQNTGSMSQQIKQYMMENKLSILNAVQEIALVLISNSDNQPSQKSFGISEKFAKNLGSSNLQKIKTHVLVGKSQQEIRSYIAENLNSKKYQQLNVNSQEIEKIQSFLSVKPSEKRRVLAQVQQTQPTSYIIRFFFTLIFILVIFGSLSAIVCMDNRKDTLLYAKFIADVGR